jgi:diadenosine tetraphosphate (Ap4A) HIT family hydrolase
MPRLITRAEALERIKSERGAASCLMCAIRDRAAGRTLVVHEEERQLVILPRYVRRWGQIMVMPKAHTTSFTDVDDSTWRATNALALHAARTAERVLSPRRCYVASTGSSAGEITQSSTHLHVHIIPLHDADDRPADVFSWADGVFIANEDEWDELLARIRAAWSLDS